MRRARWASCEAGRHCRIFSEGVRSNDSDILYESIIAIQKIRDPLAGPKFNTSSVT